MRRGGRREARSRPASIRALALGVGMECLSNKGSNLHATTPAAPGTNFARLAVWAVSGDDTKVMGVDRVAVNGVTALRSWRSFAGPSCARDGAALSLI